MSLVYLLFRASWKIIVLAIIFGLISGVSQIALIRMIRMPVRQHVMPGEELIWAFVGLCALSLVSRTLVQMILIRVSNRSMSKMTRQITEQIQRVPLRRLEDLGHVKFTSVMTADVQTISKAVNKLAIICMNAIILACGLSYVGYVAPKLIAFLGAAVAIGGFIIFLFSKPTRKHTRKTREAQTNLYKLLREMVTGVKELKLHRERREAYLKEAVMEADDELRASTKTGAKYQALFSSCSRLLFFVGLGLLVFVWPHYDRIEPESQFTVIIVMFFMMGPLEQVMALLPTVIKTQASVKRLQKLGFLIGEEFESAPKEPTELPADWKTIELIGATISYTHEAPDEEEEPDVPAIVDKDEDADDKPLPVPEVNEATAETAFRLGPITLTVRRGEMLFIVGGNGSGKTTLVKLLTGLYPPDAGEVRVDDRKIEEDDIEAYRQLFSVVFADVVIFNHLYGVDLLTQEDKIQDLLQRLHLTRDVTITDGTISTTTALSRGQRKRLALVAAYLEDRPIYVFDEWAADQDPLFKRVFYQQILPELKARNKAVVVVTHDDNYFKMADRIVTLRDGQVIDGYSEELLVQQGQGRSASANFNEE